MVDLVSSEVEATAEEATQADVPSLVPDVAAEAISAAVEAVDPRSPGSGPSPVMESPGSGLPSSSSWTSGEPGSPDQLTNRVLRAYDPAAEAFEKYSERITR